MIALLLHMHQPDYRDPTSRVPRMPWVRLHATRGYTDVPALVRELGAAVTLNLVPSLLDQWDHYAEGGSDPWLDLAQRPAATLAPHEIAWMSEHFFAGHPGAYRWFPGWGRLLAHRESGRPWTPALLRDLQVWSNLAWFGFTALREFPVLAELRARGRDFSESDKEAVLGAQRALLAGLRARWRDLPEVSASPYTHPILPLLVDTAHAGRCMPGVPDPGFRAPEDAREQLVRGRARVEAWTGASVRGLWPSEGSVSPEVLRLAADAGFRWVATDDGVRARSERDVGSAGEEGPWRDRDTGLRVLFRDQALSDRVGFVYATWDGAAAAEDLLARCGAVPGAGGSTPRNAPRRVVLALDGENPWESYPDAGEGFLRAFLARPGLVTCGALADTEPAGTIRRIHTGSWIRADFAIWIGHPEDRAAWRLLAETRAAWEAAGRPPAGLEPLLAAEGSDWFWWFGDDFSTPFAPHFDALFRAHLAACWRACGREPPEALHRPVRGARPVEVTPPRATLPEPDGPDWFAWAGAGRIDLRGSAMAPSPGTPRIAWFGARGGCPVLRVETDGAALAADWVVLALTHPGDPRPVRVPLVEGRAVLPVETAWVAWVGPDGQRLPAEGAVALPWRAAATPPLPF
ncbi:MAG: hypothetical protein RLZZ299_1536 [Pseudomonadota bacterium]